MKVGLSANLLEPAYVRRGLDGIGIYTSVLKDGLPRHGVDVDCWSFPKWGKAEITVGKCWPAPHEAMLARDLALPFLRTRLPVDLYHVTDYRVIRMQCPVVATLHDAIPMMFPQWYGGPVRKLKNALLRLTAKHADHVIALSHFSITELVTCFGVDEKRISVVPCGVFPHWLEQIDTQDMQKTIETHGLRPGYFLFVGTLQPRKNIERILAAYLQLPQALRRERQLVIVGRAGWRCTELLARIKAAQQRGEPVVWLNYVEGETALRHLYSAAGALVFPSLHEGFGIPVLEAFASRTPVVTSNTTSLPEASGGAALEIDPTSVDAIADAMQTIVKDERLRERCIDAGYRRAQQLSWDNTANMTADVYRRVLGRL